MHQTYKTNGTCSTQIDFDIEDNKIYNLKFTGGCNGNLKGIAALVEGEDITTVKNKLKGIKLHFRIFEYPTSSQAETIYQIIKNYHIEGQIFIKDADSMYVCDKEIKGNAVMVYSLENTPIVDPQHKSYVAIDDQNFVTNIIEKKVVSNLFNCGGYSFASALDFIEAYEHVLEFEDIFSHMYISHIIYWLILNKKLKFRPIEAIGYEDFEIKQ